MKLQKIISATGINGTIEGRIVILMSYSSKIIEVHNHSTHDEDKKIVYLHKVEAYVDGVLFKETKDFDSEGDVEKFLRIFEKLFTKHIQHVSNNVPEKTFRERMRENGYI